jgi:small subunit ribosomal protein S9
MEKAKAPVKTKKKPVKKAVAVKTKEVEIKPVAKKEKKETEPIIAQPIFEPAAEAENFDAGSDFDEKDKKNKKYFEAVGRRKTAVARVRLLTIKPFEGEEGKITVNNKFYKQYFPTIELQQISEAALRKLKSLNRFEVVAKIKGGGIRAQAEALRHGTARVLVDFNIDFRKKLKKAGYLKRDARAVERKKFGLKKARRAPQWAKR